MHYKTPVRCRMGLLCKGIQSNRHPWEKHSINKDGGQNCLSVALCTGGLIPGGTIPCHRNAREKSGGFVHYQRRKHHRKPYQGHRNGHRKATPREPQAQEQNLYDKSKPCTHHKRRTHRPLIYLSFIFLYKRY